MRNPVWTNIGGTAALMIISLMASIGTPARARSGDEWPQFRGPDGQGRGAAARLPATWSESENVRWKSAIPGRAWSSPVIADGICWLTTAVPRELSAEEKQAKKDPAPAKAGGVPVSALDAVSLRAVAVELETGKVRHDVELLAVSHPEAIHALNSYASPTPILKNGRLYCHFGNLGTACVDTASAEIVWKTRLPNEHGVGPGSSPVVYDNLLIVPCDGIEAQFVTAIDVASGEEVWKTPRPPLTGDNGDFHKAFSTPLVIDDAAAGRDARPQVVAVGAQWVVAYDPRDGAEIWKVRFGEGFSNAPRPVYANGIVYICTGYMNPELWAIRTDGRGDVTETHVVWQIKKQVPTMSSPILVGNVLYIVSEQGVVTCADAKTGAVRFQKRVPGSYSASPVAVDGKLVFANREGEMTVVKASESWQELSHNRLKGEILSSPAAWRDSWIVRTDSHLYRIGASASP